MIEFYVSPTTTNRFAIDGATLAIDQERLVRFALVVTSPQRRAQCVLRSAAL